jgi:hypothetical protein
LPWVINLKKLLAVAVGYEAKSVGGMNRVGELCVAAGVGMICPAS